MNQNINKNIWVFASNLAGKHGKGSALEARKNHGAIYGQGEGLQGNSYGIPTKDRELQILPLDSIKVNIDRFIEFAKTHNEMQFNVVKIGCGLAGYKEEQIAPLFRKAIHEKNILLPEGWVKIIQHDILDEITALGQEMDVQKSAKPLSGGGTYIEN